MVLEQILFDRLDASISSGPPSQSVLVAEWQQNTDTACVMAYMADAASCSTQSELLFRPDILTEYQTFGVRDMPVSYTHLTLPTRR